MTESHHSNEAGSDPPPSSQYRAVHGQEAHHIRIPTHLPTAKLCQLFLKPSFIHPIDDTTKEPSKDFHSVPGSWDVQTQRHFQHHLSFLKISFTSTTGPLRLQRHYRQQSPLLPGLQSPVRLFSGLGERSVPSFCAFTLPSAIPSSMSLVSSRAFAHMGS